MATLDFDFWISKDIIHQRYDVSVVLDHKHGKYAVAMPLTMKTPTEEDQGAYLHPTMSLTKESAVRLMDAMWEVGIRPSNGEGNAGELAATKHHLDDMRKIVFDMMELKK